MSDDIKFKREEDILAVTFRGKRRELTYERNGEDHQGKLLVKERVYVQCPPLFSNQEECKEKYCMVCA